jgi:hypothetical protein
LVDRLLEERGRRGVVEGPLTLLWRLPGAGVGKLGEAGPSCTLADRVGPGADPITLADRGVTGEGRRLGEVEPGTALLTVPRDAGSHAAPPPPLPASGDMGGVEAPLDESRKAIQGVKASTAGYKEGDRSLAPYTLTGR